MLIQRPVYDKQLKCVAFEILYCAQDVVNTEELSSKLMRLVKTADAQLPLFIPFELKSIFEDLATTIENPIILKLPAEEVEVVYSLEELKQCTLSIALLINTTQQLAWLNFADYIGLTEQLMEQANIEKVVQYSKEKQRKVIAYGLARPLNFDKCKKLSIDYFCGDFLFKPLLDEHTELAANKLNVLQLIQTLQSEDCDLQSIAQLIQADPLLSYQLLRLVNSAVFSAASPITSIEQAVARLGIINLKNWVLLFSMQNISDKPVEVLESGLIRAIMAQKLAANDPKVNTHSAYTAGLLSILDNLLNQPIEIILNQITLSEDINNALIYHSGPLGELLCVVMAYESGHWELITEETVNNLDLSRIYIDSLTYVTESKSTKQHA